MIRRLSPTNMLSSMSNADLKGYSITCLMLHSDVSRMTIEFASNNFQKSNPTNYTPFNFLVTLLPLIPRHIICILNFYLSRSCVPANTTAMVRPQSSLLHTAAFLLSVPSFIHASPGLDCSKIVSQGVQWSLKELGGDRTVHWVREDGVIRKNTTFTIDICKPIGKKKDLKPEEQCQGGTNGENSRHLIEACCPRFLDIN